ncbi:NAD(P)H-binding protein [Mycobacterium hodleri]|uniref:SDR family oxidoreductase n=1 Tax=Mycolicibacterium hodleri TaxID=49897 RepID=UPI0035570910|nr:NAD(P)H-binding protein [Mycolicibacterium hodleri]
MPTLIFGATGALGGRVLDALVARGVAERDVTAAGRNTETLANYGGRGFGTAHVDVSDPSQVSRAVKGHDAVVLISGTEPDRVAQHTRVIEAAQKAGVAEFYYTSGVRADDPRSRPVGADHAATEDILRGAGCATRSRATGGTSRTTCRICAAPSTPAPSPPRSVTRSWHRDRVATSPRPSRSSSPPRDTNEDLQFH